MVSFITIIVLDFLLIWIMQIRNFLTMYSLWHTHSLATRPNSLNVTFLNCFHSPYLASGSWLYYFACEIGIQVQRQEGDHAPQTNQINVFFFLVHVIVASSFYDFQVHHTRDISPFPSWSFPCTWPASSLCQTTWWQWLCCSSICRPSDCFHFGIAPQYSCLTRTRIGTWSNNIVSIFIKETKLKHHNSIHMFVF